MELPLAIFSGQIAAALVSGNCVIAKPAEQTPLIAAQAVQMLMGSWCATRCCTASSGSR
jgi:delta 1-pyrroline-5-carboxylate dehydrogenase